MKTPLNDATEVGSALERLGFVVFRFANTDKATLERALLEFHETASNAEIAVVFYSGHGVVVDGTHSLVPVDAQYRSGTVPLGLVMSAVEPASVLRLILLDVDAMVDVDRRDSGK